MAIRVKCSVCGRGIKAPARLGGHTIKCPECGKPVSVPKIEAPFAVARSAEFAGRTAEATQRRGPSEPMPDSRPEPETESVTIASPWIITEILASAASAVRADFIPVLFGCWMFLATWPFYFFVLLGLPALIGYIRFLNRTIGGSPAGFKEFLVPDIVRVIYRDGFRSGLWTCVKLGVHFALFFAIELVALAAAVAVPAIPFIAVGLCVSEVSNNFWAGLLFFVPVLIFGLCAWLLWVADVFTLVYLFGTETPAKYTFDVFCEYFVRSWARIRENRAAYIQLFVGEIVLVALAAAFTVVVYLVGAHAGAARYLLYGLAAAMWAVLIPLLIYLNVFFVRGMTESAPAKMERT